MTDRRKKSEEYNARYLFWIKSQLYKYIHRLTVVSHKTEPNIQKNCEY